ncbi:hypothetical protein BV898_01767 [Hypsibius exemplaris]|uniref:RING-type domain-containing protein n=1 Tax=Hypsibius exemplaris TaxID=2072580 RepID=A0A1W0X9Q0_HYPEX|nr:hypothetical protein BV898_01767 [Hypsibius exemplaris]
MASCGLGVMEQQSGAQCASWRGEFLAAQPNELRMWSKAKELLYGYMLIWIFMCLPKIYHNLYNLPVKEYVLSCLKWMRRPRKLSSISPGGVQNTKKYLDSGCPVCLASTDEMLDLTPVHGECGHALCAECFVGMWNHGKVLLFPLSCPLCTATLQKMTSVTKWDPSMLPDARMEHLDRTIRRYNLVFSGRCVGILPASSKTVSLAVMDIISRTLRLGYFFVLFDRKVMNTLSFFLMHFVMAVVVEYFEGAYMRNILEMDL